MSAPDDIINGSTWHLPGLSPAFPNPSFAFTTIPYHGARDGRVLVDVIDAMGNVVSVVVDDVLDAGNYEAPFATHDLSSCVYVVRIRSGSDVDSKTFVVLR